MVFNFLFLLSITSPANAGSTLPYQVCPALTDDAKKIGEKIEKLRNAIKKTEDCKSIPEDLALVKELITTPAWKDIKESMKSGAVQLEGAKLNTINDLVTRASSSLSEVVTRIAGAKECYDKKDEDLVLSSISGITREVSGVISAVTGPYGAAVSMGGNILGSAIEGIVKLVKSLSSYKFKKLEDENLFVDQFCAFADIQRDINDNLNLEDQKNDLAVLRGYLEKKIAIILQHCPSCEGYKAAYLAKKEADKLAAVLSAQANVVAITDEYVRQPLYRCEEMDLVVHSGLSNLNEYLKVFRNYKNPATTPEENAYVNSAYNIGATIAASFPDRNTCMAMDPNEVSKISKYFNLTMLNGVLSLSDRYFLTQMNRFHNDANMKFKQPLGDYIESSFERLNWVKAHEKDVEISLRNSNYDYSTSVIREERNRLKKLVMSEVFPRYLRFQIRRIIKNMNQFAAKAIFVEGNSNQSVSDELANRRLGLDSRLTQAEENETRGLLKTALTRTRTFIRYCDFVNYLMIADEKMNIICRDGEAKLKERYKQATDDPVTAAWLDTEVVESLWDHSDEHIQTSRTAEYSELLANWIAQGDSRWESASTR